MTQAGRRHRIRWRWGRCPRCGADAWIDTEDPRIVACSRACRGFSIWDWLESSYTWEQQFGVAFGLRSFDARGRPDGIEATPR
jgi:endogenous inhibitor of DNA gyrase (YacG/DUF329 family)